MTDVRTLETMLSDRVYARPRFNLPLFSVFAGLGWLLALLGVHGVIANSVLQRTREIGIRFALGARYTQVIGMVLRLAGQLLAIGVVLAVIASVAPARLLKGLVQNVSTIDGVPGGGDCPVVRDWPVRQLNGAKGSARGSCNGAAGRVSRGYITNALKNNLNAW